MSTITKRILIITLSALFVGLVVFLMVINWTLISAAFTGKEVYKNSDIYAQEDFGKGMGEAEADTLKDTESNLENNIADAQDRNDNGYEPDSGEVEDLLGELSELDRTAIESLNALKTMYTDLLDSFTDALPSLEDELEDIDEQIEQMEEEEQDTTELEIVRAELSAQITAIKDSISRLEGEIAEVDEDLAQYESVTDAQAPAAA